MSTSLANPRRTKLAVWPSQGSENPDQEQPATADSAPSATEDQSTGQ